MTTTYRKDIDGLRAIAVIAVILFHLDLLPNGFLGVDIFFVISGYLITGILYQSIQTNSFSVLQFYMKRVRRILPLVLFSCLFSLVIGVIFMLPDDLENLCQSIIATLFSSNNLLLYITSGDYWAIKNHYKPLMHTWSLGVEEQFYIIYPLLFFLVRGRRIKLLFSILVILTIISIIGALFYTDEAIKFFFLPFRFFELSLGGLVAIYNIDNNNNSFKQKSISHFYILNISVILILSNLFFTFFDNTTSNIIFTVVFSAIIIYFGQNYLQYKNVYSLIFTNWLVVMIGKLSFSLYIWHHIVFAFVRYFLFENINLINGTLLIILVVLFSIFTFYFIENPFRNKNRINNKNVLKVVSILLIVITGLSLYIYLIGGNIKNIPELGIDKNELSKNYNFFSPQNNINIAYNEKVRNLDKPFSDKLENKKLIKVLVLGDSFGRDFVNLLLESDFSQKLEIRYSDFSNQNQNELLNRIKKADFIFFGSFAASSLEKSKIEEFSLPMNKVWIVGIKDFGNSNGIHYNRKIENYRNYRTNLKKGTLEKNNQLNKKWKNKYIDLLEPVLDQNNRILVFTPDGKFISQDTGHFTRFGAEFYAKIMNDKLIKILNIEIENIK